MAAFNHISGQEPSTVSFKLATVTQTRNSSLMHQEILTLGDPESSLALAAVLNAKPPSTTWALAVREVSTHSTTVNVSSVAGVVAVAQNSTVWQVQVGGYSTIAAVSSVSGVVAVAQNSTVWAVQVAGYSTVAQVSSVGGVVNVAQNSTVWQVQVGGYSTIVAVSSLGGAVNVRSSAANALMTAYQSSAADLNVTVAGYSTIVKVSSLGGLVTVAPGDTNWASSAGFHFDTSGNLNIAGSFSASTTVNVSSVSGVVRTTPSDTQWHTLAGLHFDTSGNLLVTGLAQSTTANSTVNVSSVAGVVSVAQNSTTWAVQLSQYSTIAAISSVSGVVNVQQNSTVWQVQVGDYSTIVAVSSVSGVVNVQQNSTTWAVQLTQYSTTVAVSSVSGVVSVTSPMISTATPSSGSSGFVVREVIDNLLVNASTNFFTSSLVAIASTAAGQRCKVFAYSITTTNQTPTKLAFYGGSSLKWTVVLAALSSAVSGVNLAVSPPAYLFACAAGSSMTLRTTSSGAGWKVSVGYFMSQ